ncbi:MAG: hypothetical protein ACFCGT_18045 [Sandaracinaceae bacterium]
MIRRLDLCDPTPEGPWIAHRLREAGFEVHERSPGEPPSGDGEVLLVAGDVPGIPEAVDRLRAAGRLAGRPVVMLGAPAGEAEREQLAAHDALRRPVSFDRLLATVRRLLEPAPPSARLLAPDDGSSQVLSVGGVPRGPSWRPPEPTLQLREDGVAEEPSGVASKPPPSEPMPPAPIAEGQRAQLSERLQDLLAAADRRAFPAEPPLELHLPATEDAPEELVPAELLDTPSLGPGGPPVADPLDAFTFAGGPPIPPPIGVDEEASTGSLGHGTDEREPPETLTGRLAEGGVTTGVHAAGYAPEEVPPRAWPRDDPVLGALEADGSRSGVLGPGGGLRLLFHLLEHGLHGRLAIGPPASPVRLRVGGGTVVLEGQGGELAAVEALKRRGLGLGRPTSAAEAERWLRTAVEAGRVTAFERDRALREGREERLAACLVADRMPFRAWPDEAMAAGPDPEGRPLGALLLTLAGRALDHERVGRWLGPAPVGLALVEERAARLAVWGLPPELGALLRRHRGASVDALLRAAPDVPGLPGILYALLAADVLALVPLTDDMPRGRPRLRERLLSLAARAADADYFTVLGLEVDATPAELAAAHQRVRAELEGLPLDALGLGDLRPLRLEALQAVDEAFELLRVPRWRRAYARARRALAAHDPRY